MAALDDPALDQLFREAHTHQYFDGREVTAAELEAIWDLAKMAPTSMNTQPVRVVWCKSEAAKERLAAHAASGNVEKVRHAPVCAIIAMDSDFHLYLEEFAPHMKNPAAMFEGEAKLAMREQFAFRNASLQGAYLIMAARALGFDCGPMSGFDNAGVDADFFADTPSWKSNFICSIGHGDPSKLHSRAPRPAFERFNRVL